MDEFTVTRHARITAGLTAAFTPTQLDLRDESHLHAGHNADAGHVEDGTFKSGGTHFRLTIASPALTGLSRIEQQRRINACLKTEFDGGLHALAITVLPA